MLLSTESPPGRGVLISVRQVSVLQSRSGKNREDTASNPSLPSTPMSQGLGFRVDRNITKRSEEFVASWSYKLWLFIHFIGAIPRFKAFVSSGSGFWAASLPTSIPSLDCGGFRKLGLGVPCFGVLLSGALY